MDLGQFSLLLQKSSTKSSNFPPFSDKGKKGKFHFFPFCNFSLPSLTIAFIYLFSSVKWLTFIAYCPRIPCPWEYLQSYSSEGLLPGEQIRIKSPGSMQFCGHFTNVTILQQCGISSCFFFLIIIIIFFLVSLLFDVLIVLWEHFLHEAPRGEKCGEKYLDFKSQWSLRINQILKCSANCSGQKKMLLRFLQDRTSRLMRHLRMKIVMFMDFKCFQRWMETEQC